MLNVQFGDMPGAIFNTAVYFENTYLPEWITQPLSVEMIKDVDKSDVVGPNLIQSPVLGPISPLQLSGGVKTLMLIANDRTHVFNASTCGDNCAKWILKIADDRARQKRKLTINLRHLMDFGKGSFKIRILDPQGNNVGIATNMREFVELGGEFA
ncbi:MAG: DUF4869 domain-containing protein [Coriobacteriales bacterium]|nr:DUF4869 domain-containing protein [Coriobacteriales bacterium]